MDGIGKVTIKQARNMRELTQLYCAKRLNVDVGTYRKWEKTPGKMPVDKLIEFCHLVDFEPGQINFLLSKPT